MLTQYIKRLQDKYIEGHLAGHLAGNLAGVLMVYQVGHLVQPLQELSYRS